MAGEIHHVKLRAVWIIVPAALKKISRYQSLINYNDLVAVEIEADGSTPFNSQRPAWAA
jgi:hypothetical protein